MQTQCISVSDAKAFLKTGRWRERTWECIVLYFGLDGNRIHTMKEIADQKGCSVGDVNQKIGNAIRKIRSEFWEFHFIDGERVVSSIKRGKPKLMTELISDSKIEFENRFIEINIKYVWKLVVEFGHMDSQEVFSEALNAFWYTARHFDKSRDCGSSTLGKFMLNSAMRTARFKILNLSNKSKAIKRGFGSDVFSIDAIPREEKSKETYIQIAVEDSLYYENN